MSKKNIKSINLLPEVLRTDKNSKFLSSTIDQLIQSPSLERIDGFIGSKLTPTYVSTSDVYISEPSTLRRDYQLEPALVLKDSVGAVKEVKAIDDLVNEISNRSGINSTFDRLFRSEVYSFNPRIDFDKFVNYQKYYWLVTGPSTISITGKQRGTTSTYTVVDNEIKSAWIFSPNGLTEDPTIVLYRGNTYNFDVGSNYNFYIKSAPTLGLTDVYTVNVTGNGTKEGTVSIKVDENTPSTLYYTSDEVNYVQGKIVVKQATEDSYINVEEEILGKKTYTSGSGITLSNGMKVSFGGDVYPEYYKDKEFFVEGVGSAIKLIDYSLLSGSETLSAQFDDDFDVTNFDQYPFDGFRQLPLDPEYITINRASKDLNPWSRYNRWVHEDIIKISAKANGVIPVIPASNRAKRPIIEFVANLQLYNFGTTGIKNVDLIDTETIDAFSKIEGSAGYYVDGVLLEQGHRVIFNADTDSLVRGKVYEVNFLVIAGRPRIELKPTDDHSPSLGASVSVNLGNTLSGKSWWFDGNSWVLSQQHTAINQAPLFDIFDNSGISYSGNLYNTDFAGTKVFGYDIGNGSVDPVLGFPLSYQNTASVGNYKFKNYFNTDVITLFDNNAVSTLPVSSTFLRINNDFSEFVNVWESATTCAIPILQQTSIEEETTVVELNSIDNPALTKFELHVFVNNKKITPDSWYITFDANECFVNFKTMLIAGTTVLFKIYTGAAVNSNGQYETPISLTNNPLNGPIDFLTLSEISDHLKTMADRDSEFIGDVFGSNNVRDLPNISKFGTRLISNFNPVGFASFFVSTTRHNVIDSIQKAADQYNQFKAVLFKKIAEIGNINDPVRALDNILSSINIDKDLNSPWYFSDMIAYGTDKSSRDWTVVSSDRTIYPISNDFSKSVLSFKSVLVYLNGIQLIIGKDYNFLVNDSSVEILAPITRGDVLTINEYFSTLGSYVPATPTKLGLYPKFQPSIYVDDTYVNSSNVIQGHDGSITLAFDDYRDDIILEFEKRVYNNIKAEYRSDLFDINSVLPGVFRNNDYSLDDINSVLMADFVKWTGTFSVDYITNSTFDVDIPHTWNYSGGYCSSLKSSVSGHWRSFFKYFYDTDRPNTHPWEMLGLTEEPTWWKEEYGPAPYTSGNSVLWDDLEKGVIKKGSAAGKSVLYARPGLSEVLPVNEFGGIVDPRTLITNITSYNSRKGWLFGDHGPAETAWRRSSFWPFAVQRLLALVRPATYCSVLYDPSRLTQNAAKQWVYGDQNKFLDLRTISVNRLQNTLTSGYSAYISEIGTQRDYLYVSSLASDLSFLDFNLFHKVGGFVNKNKLQVVIDAIDPSSTSPGAVLPLESYKLISNISNPISSVRMSGIIIQKVNGNFVINGYNQTNPYFTVFEPRRNTNTPTITVGGVSEPFLDWAAGNVDDNDLMSSVETTTASPSVFGNFYHQGQLVRHNQQYYRTKVSHRAGSTFNSSYFQQLATLPVIGGVTVQIANRYSDLPINVSYGTEFTSIQELYDLIVGYGKWLESKGFIFDEFQSTINEVMNWELSAKEFLFWTTQNWAENSIITLSPFADSVKYQSLNSVVDNVFDKSRDYRILKSNGLPFPQSNLSVSRDNGICTIRSVNTADGIYFVELQSVQKEHGMVFDNTTIFNDIIYDIQTGYRQRRMKLVGFRTGQWDGDFSSPGFVYDRADISDWKKYVTYQYGDTVRYSGNYYSAKGNISSSSEFDFTKWVLLNEKPTSDLIPNFEYKINQFEDFYSLDIENFDSSQQKMAQHLTGYTPRVYMNNVFINPVSQYKFYQGFIKEKGTRNAINRIAKASIFNQQGETSYTEEWAFRLGQYGSYTSYDEFEIKLEEGSFIENPQIINFVSTNPNNPIDLIYYSTSSNIEILPDDFNPLETFLTTSTNTFLFPNAGYVSFDDVTATAYNEDSLLDIANAEQIVNGDVIWLGFKTNGDWDALRYELSFANVVGVYVSSPGVDITFVTDQHHKMSIGDIISVTRFNSQVNGVYRVKSVPSLTQITVASDLTTILNEELLSPGLMYSFNSARCASFDQLPLDNEMLNYRYGTKFWVDNQLTDGTFNWEVYEKINNYNSQVIQSGFDDVLNQKLGYSISKAEHSNALLVGSPGFNNNIDNGRAFLFLKSSSSSNKLLSFSLNDYEDQYHPSAELTKFGNSVLYSATVFPGTEYGLMIVGAPAVGNLLTSGSVFRYANELGSLIASTQAGAVKISSADTANVSGKSEVVLLSPSYYNYENFGFSLASNSGNKLLIGAPGTETTGSGAVYVYDVIQPLVIRSTVSTATTGSSILYLDSTFEIEVGQSVWVRNVISDIISGVTVLTVYDDGVTKGVELSSSLQSEIPSGALVRFYDPADLNITSLGLFTSTNGLLVSYETNYVSPAAVTGDQYGYAIDATSDNSIFVISAPGGNYVEAFINDSGNYVRSILTESSINDTSRFGQSVALSNTGEYLFVGAPYCKNNDDSFGVVFVYKKDGTEFKSHSVMSNPVTGASMNFGTQVQINNSTDTVVVSSVGLNKHVTVSFNAESTTFDSSSTVFHDVIDNFGTVYVYNKIATSDRFVLATELTPSAGNFSNNFGHSIAIDEDSIFVGAPAIEVATTSSYYQYTKIDQLKSTLNLYKSYAETVDLDAIQSIRLIDSFNETVVDYLDVIDPIKGKIVGLAEQELKFKSAYDPAVYSIGTAGVVVDANTSWLDEHVGELWWDLSTVKYVWYEQGDLTYRKNNWGAMFPGATIDVYEWVSSSYLPSEWSSVADTSAGLTEGISGQPKYADNSAIAVKQIYNSVSNSFANVYYYWVKNKVTVPDSRNRRISSYQVSSLIANPSSFGVKYAALISSNAIALANISSDIVGDRIHLNVAYDKIKNVVPKHTEWTLMEEGSANSMPPVLYEKKLFDSLLGRDSLGNMVPDPSLTERTKYGISVRPRQTMFKDRRKALRELVEFSNSVLKENQITGSYNFANLNAQEFPPDIYSKLYDEVVEDNEGLSIIEVNSLKQASLSCTVLNGKIRSVTIDNPGFGYKVAPYISISSGGSGADINASIDEFGRIISVSIDNPGSGYASSPVLTVRPYTVIVLADNLYNNKWTKFEWNHFTDQWERKQTQKYNTTLYWEYVDWTSPSYNEYIDYAYVVDQVYQLDTLEDVTVGQYVKIKNIGDGRYAVVEKMTDGTEGTFGKGYDLVYSQNGTIQILDKIWDVRDSNLGFDQKNNFDQTLYDQTPDLELGYLLASLKNDIFVNDLKLNWNLFFFKAVKYALTEQKLLDWAFKTSFINVTNYAGRLDQRPVYKLQSSRNYEKYIEEVKPYHSQIRSFTANHEVYEPSNSFFTDFDLPPVYNQISNKFETVEVGSALMAQQPWKSWKNNYYYVVSNIVVGSGGAGYTYPPQITIETAAGDTGQGATARAYISSGKVSKIEIINAGSGYKIAPRVIITGGGNASLTPAIAYAQLYNGKVRTNLVGIKFDRISKAPSITDRSAVDTFVCNGYLGEFVLSWYADPDKTKINISLDGELVLGSDYRLENYQEFYNGYNKNFTKVVFLKSVPSYGQILEISYSKNIGLFNAVDRIVEFYTATSGMPGKDLPQLMDGIEYPGVSVQGIPFDYSSSWDVSYSPFGTSSYADNVGQYTSVKVVSSATTGTNVFVVSTTAGIVVGQNVNIVSADKDQQLSLFYSQTLDYTANVVVTAVDNDTRTVTVNSTITQALNGVTTQVYIGNTLTSVVNTATIEFWAYDSNVSLLDSAIEGGTLDNLSNRFSNALGINPEEIIIDGDKFISPNTQYAPEEVVPGEIHDSVGISVYTKTNQGSAAVYNGVVDVYSYTTTTAVLGIMPPNVSGLFVTFAGRNFSLSTGTTHLSTIDSSEFSYIWETNQIVVGPQTYQGKLGYTIVGIGGGRKSVEAGILDNGISYVNDGSSDAEVTSISTTATVKSAYVTVNGQSIPKLTTETTSTMGYRLITSEREPSRAAVHVYNLSTSTTSTVQAWFFGTVDKRFNEFKEQIYEITDFESNFILDYPPGLIEPAAGNIIVEIDDGSGVGYKRLQPPFISYYKVQNNVLTYKIDKNISRLPGSFVNSKVRVYLNGAQLTPAADYYFDYDNQTIDVRSGVISDGDELAILGIPNFGEHIAEFDIQDNQLTLMTPVSGVKLKVITFANHDSLSMRVESFAGSLNRRFKVSRHIADSNYVWVTVNGQLLVNKYDYTVLDDGRTVELSDNWHTTSPDSVVITSVSSEMLAGSVVGYRIFNDIFNRYHYKRLSGKNTTVLSKPLFESDTEIHVEDASVLTPPLVSKKIPGVVLINRERIEFFHADGNVLKNIRRSTIGTGPAEFLQAGTKVIDQGVSQTVPYDDCYYKQVILTSSSTSTYSISAISTVTTGITTSNVFLSDGIMLSTTSTVNPVDQIEVYYGGRKLRKAGTYYHDISISYDSPAANVIGFTSTTALLPLTTEINTAYVVTSTNQVWVYTGSVEKSAVNGYVYKGLNYLNPEFSVTVDINTATAATYAINALRMALHLDPPEVPAYDINGSGQITSADAYRYSRLANGGYVENINENSNYSTLLQQTIKLNIAEGIKDGVKLTILKRGFRKADIWNTQLSAISTKSLLDSTTSPAKFLQEKQAEMPDIYYYGGSPALDMDNGLALTDETDEPLEGL